MKKPTLVVVHGPGSAGPRDALRAAHGRYDVVFAVQDADPECTAALPLLSRLAPVFRLSDDASSMRELTSVQPAGIVTFTESQLPFAARLADVLDLRFHTPQTVDLLTNKFMQRRAMNAAGVSVTMVEEVADPVALPVAAGRIGYPVVIKPVVNNSSRWTTRCDSEDDVEGLISAITASPDAPTRWIVEEMLRPGAHPYGDVLADFVSVESVVQDGKVSHFCLTDRLAMAPPFRERGLLVPTLLREADRGPLLDLATAALGALGVRWGVTHTEIKLTPDGPRIIEVNGRLGGWIPELVRRVSAMDPVTMAVDVAMGRQVDVDADVEHADFSRTHAAVLLVQPPEGRYRILDMADPSVLRQQPGVWQAWQRAAPGDIVDSRAGSLQALYAAYIEADRQSMADRLRQVEQVARGAAALGVEQ